MMDVEECVELDKGLGHGEDADIWRMQEGNEDDELCHVPMIYVLTMGRKKDSLAPTLFCSVY